MRFWTFSDAHIDVGAAKYPFRLPATLPEADALIVAGDMREKLTRSVEVLAAFPWTKPIIYVAGNHDFYRCEIDSERAKAAARLEQLNRARRELGYGDIHVLQDSWCQVGDARIFGATLWTDYELAGEGFKGISMLTAKDFMNDHKLIRKGKEYRKFLPFDALQEHKDSVAWLKNALDECPADKKRVVVTHHAPSERSIAPYYARSALNPAYASDLEALASRADLWIHGHVHSCFSYVLGDCYVSCNPRGYHGTENYSFNPSLVIDI